MKGCSVHRHVSTIRDLNKIFMSLVQSQIYIHVVQSWIYIGLGQTQLNIELLKWILNTFYLFYCNCLSYMYRQNSNINPFQLALLSLNVFVQWYDHTRRSNHQCTFFSYSKRKFEILNRSPAVNIHTCKSLFNFITKGV